MKLNENLFKPNLKIGDIIKITSMSGEPEYTGKKGIVQHIDDAGQIHGTWGGCAIIPEEDEFEIIGETSEEIETLDEDIEEKSVNPRIRDYRKYAQLKDTDVITEDNLDDWAINRTCRIHVCDRDDLIEDLLSESLLETTIEQAAKQASRGIEDVEVVTQKTQIEKVLDDALDANEEQNELGSKNYQNVLLIGEAGTGKTSIVRKWAKENNINLYEVRAAGMDDTDLGGAITPSDDKQTVVRLNSTEFDVLDRPRSVLFLDEYNRAPQTVRTQLLELINHHVLPDSRDPNGQRFLKNFLFTIAAINPANANYNTDTLDMAEKTRFRNVDVRPNPRELLTYLTGVYNDMAERASKPERKQRALGRANLAKALLTNKEFRFDNQEDIERSMEEGNGLALNYRTLTNLLNGSNGTKDDLLAKWPEYTNNLKLNMAKSILQNYEDIDDKANDALKQGTDSQVFKKEDSLWNRVMNHLGD